jgi:hypothetical protein
MCAASVPKSQCRTKNRYRSARRCVPTRKQVLGDFAKTAQPQREPKRNAPGTPITSCCLRRQIRAARCHEWSSGRARRTPHRRDRSTSRLASSRRLLDRCCLNSGRSGMAPSRLPFTPAGTWSRMLAPGTFRGRCRWLHRYALVQLSLGAKVQSESSACPSELAAV